MVRLSDLPFPLPVPLFQSWLYIPDEPIGDPSSLSAQIVGCTGRPTRTVGYLAIAILASTYTIPGPGTFSNLSSFEDFEDAAVVAGAALVTSRCLALMLLFYGGWHMWLYGVGGKPFLAKLAPRKFNPSNKGYNVVRDFTASTWGTSISVAYELALLWLCDTGKLRLDGYRVGESDDEAAFFGRETWARNLAIMLFIPYWVEGHFYFGHRFLHINTKWAPLYKYIHSFHHKAVNPGPWSGLSMHPLEHIIFFSACLLPFCLPCNMHLLHVIFILSYTRISPIGGHDGYDKPLGGSLVHYLHHTKFEVNYGTPVVPFDVWFGTYDDGSAFREKTKIVDIMAPVSQQAGATKKAS